MNSKKEILKMGEAKARGTFEQRKKSALDTMTDLKTVMNKLDDHFTKTGLKNRYDHYPQHKRFKPIMPVPTSHYFVLTEAHIKKAGEGQITTKLIKDMEASNNKPSCGYPGCPLMFEEHGLNLVILIDLKPYKDPNKDKELKDYLAQISPIATQEGFKNFVFCNKEKLLTHIENLNRSKGGMENYQSAKE